VRWEKGKSSGGKSRGINKRVIQGCDVSCGISSLLGVLMKERDKSQEPVVGGREIRKFNN